MKRTYLLGSTFFSSGDIQLIHVKINLCMHHRYISSSWGQIHIRSIGNGIAFCLKNRSKKSRAHQSVIITYTMQGLLLWIPYNHKSASMRTKPVYEKLTTKRSVIMKVELMPRGLLKISSWWYYVKISMWNISFISISRIILTIMKIACQAYSSSMACHYRMYSLYYKS